MILYIEHPTNAPIEIDGTQEQITIWQMPDNVIRLEVEQIEELVNKLIEIKNQIK